MRAAAAAAALLPTAAAAGGGPLPPLPTPGYPGIRSQFADLPDRGLRMHYLESGWNVTDAPLVVLLHGYPELAYSWRKQLEPMAAAGYRVVAPDHRCVGRTTGCDTAYDAPQGNYTTTAMASDVLSLVHSLGYKKVAAVIGHDFGSGLSVACAQQFPDVFTSVVHMSAPHGTPSIFPLDMQLAKLDPPRKHYMHYYTTREANGDMVNAPQGLHDFFRGYSHFKSGDWNGTRGPGGDMPHDLDTSLSPKYKCFAELPHYYVMLKSQNMAQGVADAMPSPEEIRTLSSKWLPEEELQVYVEEFGRTGFQGGLNWYRGGTDARYAAGKITVPAAFVAGAADWGVYQLPGSFESMPSSFADFRGSHIVPGGGHWVQQEQHATVTQLLLDFIHNVTAA